MAAFDGEKFRLAILDNNLQELRKLVCNTLATALEESGRRLWVFGLAVDQPHRTATSLVTQMGGELGRGATLLFSAKNWYAGAALVRQLVELEYLMYLFSTDQDEPARWLASSQLELRTLYSPSQMRRKSGTEFRNNEYWAHCKMGGHPNPASHSLLPEHSFPIESKCVLWVDLGQHLERLWSYFEGAVEQLDLSGIGQIQEDRIKISTLLHKWHEQDYCSNRIPDEGLSSLQDALTQREKPPSLSAYLRSLE